MPDSSNLPDAPSLYAQAREAAAFIADASSLRPRIGIVLGSGLGVVADAVASDAIIPYTSIPHIPPPSVLGHAGELVLGVFGDVSVAVLRGRVHLYEGYSPQQSTFPIRVLRLLGVETLFLTNAAGGVDPALRVGSLLLLRDHIGFPSLAGLNPLFGPNDERFGERFIAMNDAYDPALRQLAQSVAAQRGIPLAEGVYAMVGGPNFETPAELRMLRTLGVDAVGMSTVPEVIVARHMGMRVCAISMITNQALGEENDTTPPDIPDHERVLRIAEAASGHLATLLADVIAQIR